jgi:hypothetical protein
VEIAEVTNDGVRHLQSLKNLEFLGIGATKTISDGAFEHMARMPGLTEILVSGCKGIVGSGVSTLSSLKKLRKLQLARTSITDSTLGNLKNLTVEELDLGMNNLSYNGLKALLADSHALPNLKVLDIKKISLTAENLAELQKVRPALKISN